MDDESRAGPYVPDHYDDNWVRREEAEIEAARKPQALVVPAEGPIEQIRLREVADSALAHLQELVGGDIEAVPLPDFITGYDATTAYINGEGKFNPDCKPNMRATDFFVPGVGLFYGDYIAGTMVLVGFDARTGKHRRKLPEGVTKRIHLIAREARA
jgi:hypothetical protein